MIIKDFTKAGHIEVEFTLDEIEKLAKICNFAVVEAPYKSETFHDALDFVDSFYEIL